MIEGNGSETMQALIEQLISELEYAISQYSCLLPLLATERKAALEWNVQALVEATTEKQVVLARLSYSDRKRSRLLSQIADQLHLPERQLTLRLLAEKVRSPLGTRLSSLHAGLKNLLEKIRRSNDENRLTVEHCLGLVQNSLAFWQYWTGPPKVYGVSGVINHGNGTGRVLSGAV
jgi:flagellar biosynthesis/type III secretory pathway chaperone